MDDPDLFALFVQPLHRTGIRYMIVGSVASMHYGEPRFTMDVDVVIHIGAADIAALTQAFPEASYYLPPAELIVEEIRRREKGHFNVIHGDTGLKADLYPARSDPGWAWVWERRHCDIVDGRPAYFAPPEYVIISKLEFFREGGSGKHLRDIHGMLKVSGAEIDRPLIERVVHELGLTDAWRAALAE